MKAPSSVNDNGAKVYITQVPFGKLQKMFNDWLYCLNSEKDGSTLLQIQ